MKLYSRLLVVLITIEFVAAKETVSARIRNDDSSEEDEDVFVPTKEWQTIKEGQTIPKGLHVRLNLQTGEREAKLLDENEKSDRTDIASIPDEKTVERSNDGKPDILLNDNRVRDSILKIENVDGETTISKDDGQVHKKFRTYEELKKKFEELNLNVKTDMELLQELIKKLKSKKLLQEEHEDEILAILTDLEYLVHQYDNAQEYVKMGGIAETLPLLNATSPQLRSSAAHLMGSAAQSNVRVQIALLESGVLPALVRAVVLDTDHTVRARALFALSCLIRNFPLAQVHLVKDGGLAGLAELFAAGDGHDTLKLQMKVVTLIQDLLQERADAIVANDTQKEERNRQYRQAGLEAHLSEHGWCRRLADLLISQAQIPAFGAGSIRRDDLSSAVADDIPIATHHDTIEKVAGAVLGLARGPCKAEYRSLPQLATVVSKLRMWYRELANREAVSDGSYFSAMAQLFDFLDSEIVPQKDEL